MRAALHLDRLNVQPILFSTLREEATLQQSSTAGERVSLPLSGTPTVGPVWQTLCCCHTNSPTSIMFVMTQHSLAADCQAQLSINKYEPWCCFIRQRLTSLHQGMMCFPASYKAGSSHEQRVSSNPEKPARYDYLVVWPSGTSSTPRASGQAAAHLLEVALHLVTMTTMLGYRQHIRSCCTGRLLALFLLPIFFLCC